jgi:hypothetical protein
VEKSSYAGIPPTKTCINCHAQIWTNAQLLQPVRQSWATGASINWIRVHDLPDYVYFNHQIHVNKGIGCASCHGRVDEMPLMYQQNTLQMEWCLNCHRNPGVNLRPTAEIYNMAWAGPSTDKPVWCADTQKVGGALNYNADGSRVPTAQSVTCTTTRPGGGSPMYASLQQLSIGPRGMGRSQSGTSMQPHPTSGGGDTVSDVPPMGIIEPAKYEMFTSQEQLGKYLTGKYHIRTANELSSCEVCHR